jgi:hypothetical protein
LEEKRKEKKGIAKGMRNNRWKKSEIPQKGKE